MSELTKKLIDRPVCDHDLLVTLTNWCPERKSWCATDIVNR